jgi:general stress protein YciG
VGTKNGAKKRRKKTGFARLSAAKRAELGRRGGKMAKGRHRFTKKEASEAGKKGMKIRYGKEGEHGEET